MRNMYMEKIQALTTPTRNPQRAAPAPTPQVRPGQPQQQQRAGSAIDRARAAGIPGKVAQSYSATPGDDQSYLAQFHDANGSFNPVGFGGTSWQNGADRAQRGAAPAFDRTGQINAWNRQDALIQGQNLLSNAARAFHAARQRRNAARKMTAEKRMMLAAAMKSPEGFRVIGQELALPIKVILDYSGWSRKLLRERVLEPGENFRIPLDVRANAMILSQDAQGLESRAYVRWVTPGEVALASYPSVAIEDLYEATYDLLDRMQNTARQEVELEEDKRTVKLVDQAATRVNDVVAFGTMGIGAFEDIRYQVERHRLIVETFALHRQEQSDLIKTMSAQVDPVTERELILAGFVGTILNCTIITSAGLAAEEVVPPGTVYAMTGPDTLGEFGIRAELMAEPWTGFSQQRAVKGLMFFEKIAPIIVNARSCAKGVKV